MIKGAFNLKIVLSLIAGAAIGVTAHSLTRDNSGSLTQIGLEQQSNSIELVTDQKHYQTMHMDIYKPEGFAGNYLAGLFAQNRHDWKQANHFMKQSLNYDQNNTDLLKRGIVLAIGAGDYKDAFERAQILADIAEDDSIGQLYLTIHALNENNIDDARTILGAMKEGGIKSFVKPLLQAWLDAERGELNVEELRKNSIHITHGVLIADYLNEKDQLENLLAEAIAIGGLTIADMERAADIYIDLKNFERAETILSEVLKFAPDNQEIKTKLQKIQAGETVDGFESVESIQLGTAMALFDMAKLFYQERAYETAHIFAHMSLMLDQDNIEARIVLADIAAQNERYDEAISYYNTITEDHHFYVKAKREIARLLEDQDKTDKAIQVLEELAKKHGDNTSLIQIGDIQRRLEDFPKAIEAYNYAEKNIGSDNIIPDYWHLHYVRGMAYERNGNWELAETDLQTALDFKPDHPYLLNYLGYSWADKGKNLEQATEMIKKAVSLQPRDGYIIDSLGWVLYRQGKYDAAVPHLEKAVELMPYDPVINDHLGDAYWKVGRKIEAQFQWERAKNHIEDDDDLLATIEEKLINGLVLENPSVKHAEGNIEETEQEVLKP